MTTGLYIGKLAPIHRGHQRLIDTALDECDDVTVFIYNNRAFDIDHPDLDKVTRAYWVKQQYPQIDVRIGFNPPADDYTREGDVRHGEYIAKHYEYPIDFVYGGEDWVVPIAEVLGARPRLLPRDKHGISATKIRENPYEYAWYMAPEVRDYMLLHYGHEQGLRI